jgi:hypothetical protein
VPLTAYKLSQLPISKSTATVLLFLRANLNKFGAKSLGARPSNHVNSQKWACWPFPEDTAVLNLKRCLSRSLLVKMDRPGARTFTRLGIWIDGSTPWLNHAGPDLYERAAHLSSSLAEQVIPSKIWQPFGDAYASLNPCFVVLLENRGDLTKWFRANVRQLYMNHRPSIIHPSGTRTHVHVTCD